MSAYLELAKRCEDATGPDGILNYDIAQAVGFEKSWVTGLHPPFTSSVDAALTLVPEGMVQWVLKTAIEACSMATHSEAEFRQRLALFICAGALRARAV